MSDRIIIERTEVCYRGLPVTVVGRAAVGCLAIAAYRTPMELALGSITAATEGGGYRVHGQPGRLSSLPAAAAAIAQHREANDAAAFRTGPAPTA